MTQARFPFRMLAALKWLMNQQLGDASALDPFLCIQVDTSDAEHD